jgi:uncharacterized membrane protein
MSVRCHTGQPESIGSFRVKASGSAPRVEVMSIEDTAAEGLGSPAVQLLVRASVLRTIRRVDELAFVPLLSVSIGVLICVIRHVSVSIQAEEVVAHVGRKL